MSCALINECAGTLVHVEFNAINPTVETFQACFLNYLQQRLDEERPVTLLVDTRQMKKVPIAVCLDIVKFMKRNKLKCKNYLTASAIIVGSDFIAGLLQYVFNLSPPVSPNAVVRTAAPAVEFLQGFVNIPEGLVL
jgi:hypothetical protein